MKLRNLIFIPVLLLVMVCNLMSCGVDRWSEYAEMTALDNWVDTVMRKHYLWYKDIPSYNKLNQFQAPDAYLTSLLSKNDNKFSFADTVLSAPLPTYGFDYTLVKNSQIDTAYHALITYIIPGSAAEKAGLKRGEWIIKMGPQYISKKYEKRLLQGTKAIELTVGQWQKVVSKESGKATEDLYDVVATGTKQMPAATVVVDNPVHLYKILTLSNGEKVGYLMYNSFTAGTKEEPEKYNNELRQISKELQAANIQGLILDFRYNKGGTIDCVQLLSTLIVPSNFLNTDMASLEYNDLNSKKNKTLKFDSKVLKEGVNLNLNTIIVLTTGTTAGAPEMLMNSINKKATKLISIGSATKGQYVATERFVNDTYHWAINPAVCTVYNSEKETFIGGFAATQSINEWSDYNKVLPFGDPKEALLSVAIGVLDGTYQPPTPTNSGTSRSIVPVFNSVNSSIINSTGQPKTRLPKIVSSTASRKFIQGLQIHE